MKTIKLLSLLFVIFDYNCPGFSQSNIKNHTTSLNYFFDRSYMSYTNEFAIEPSVKFSPSYIHYPYETRKIQLYGPTLKFIVTPYVYSSDFSNDTKEYLTGGIILDSIFKRFIESKIEYTSRFPWLSKSESDSIAKGENKFQLNSLQVRIEKNDKVVGNWKDVKQLPKKGLINKIASNAFVVFNDTLELNDHVVFTFRNQKDSSLIKFDFERIGSPLLPFLATFGRDTTSISYLDFVKINIERSIKTSETINEFYQYWPAKYGGGGLASILKKDRLFADTKLSFTFRKPDPDYEDTSLQYLLAAGKIKDSVWLTTGHHLFLSDFKPGADYTLLIRYKSTPGNIQTYTFHILPAWYQTTKYKYIIGVSLILGLLGLLLFVNRIRLRQERKKIAFLNFGLKSIRSQLNPHFVFNALSSIQGLINKKDITAANHYLTEFSNLLRETLKNNDKELVPLQTELKILETYLILEQLRFHFRYEIIIDEKIDKNSVEIPSLLFQPLIENAVKHGVSTLHDNGVIKISFFSDHQNLQITICDNGNGFIENTAGSGLGMKLTKDRIALLNLSFKKQAILFSIESAQNIGTTVHLIFKNWL